MGLRIPRSVLARFARNCLWALESLKIEDYRTALDRVGKLEVQADVGDYLGFWDEGGEQPIFIQYRSFELPVIMASLAESGNGEVCVRCEEPIEGFQYEGENNGHLLLTREVSRGMPEIKELLLGLKALR